MTLFNVRYIKEGSLIIEAHTEEEALEKASEEVEEYDEIWAELFYGEEDATPELINI